MLLIRPPQAASTGVCVIMDVVEVDGFSTLGNMHCM